MTFENKFISESRFDTWRISITSTVTKMTGWRFLQLVDVETTTVANTNVVTPPTAIVVPVITYCAIDLPIGLGRMRAFHPSRSVGSTMMPGYTVACYSGSCLTGEAVPA